MPPTWLRGIAAALSANNSSPGYTAQLRPSRTYVHAYDYRERYRFRADRILSNVHRHFRGLNASLIDSCRLPIQTRSENILCLVEWNICYTLSIQPILIYNANAMHIYPLSHHGNDLITNSKAVNACKLLATEIGPKSRLIPLTAAFAGNALKKHGTKPLQ
jgi:hypothetical protein